MDQSKEDEQNKDWKAKRRTSSAKAGPAFCSPIPYFLSEIPDKNIMSASRSPPSPHCCQSKLNCSVVICTRFDKVYA